MASYDSSFFKDYEDESFRSASAFAARIAEWLAPASVIDIGCGIGTWLKAFAQHGVRESVGVDGEYVDRKQLVIPAERFVAHDLTRPLVLPDRLPSSFDLTVSMEVAEHLPEAHAADFVRTLTGFAPVVLFSAAIPYQGGTHHVNERWPGYWAAFFEKEEFVTVDCLRPVFWDDPQVAYYYAQNAFLYVRKDRLESLPALKPFVAAASDATLAKVHPRKWVEAHDPRKQSLKRILTALPHALKSTLSRHLLKR